MPTYEYRCKSCNYEFETFQSMSDASLTECPKCNGQIYRLIRSVGIQFKGSGFYLTDYNKKNKSNNNKSNKEA